LILLAGGMTTPKASTALSIPVAEAHKLRARLMRKLDVRNRADLVRLAIRTKLIEP
jgi:DNA-binding CsgD family transcriptional regulator